MGIIIKNGVEYGGGSGGAGSSVSVTYISGQIYYEAVQTGGYEGSASFKLDGKPLGLTVNWGRTKEHTILFDADFISQSQPAVIHEENNDYGGTISYMISKNGDDWYLDVYSNAITSPTPDVLEMNLMFSQASQTPAPQ